MISYFIVLCCLSKEVPGHRHCSKWPFSWKMCDKCAFDDLQGKKKKVKKKLWFYWKMKINDYEREPHKMSVGKTLRTILLHSVNFYFKFNIKSCCSSISAQNWSKIAKYINFIAKLTHAIKWTDKHVVKPWSNW
jgi:hypothetical protein